MWAWIAAVVVYVIVAAATVFVCGAIEHVLHLNDY